VGALAVAKSHQGTGLGSRIVETLVHDARALGLQRVFALTLQERFFNRLGFETTNISEFPEKVAADCTGCARRATCNEIAVACTLVTAA
jgi:amino-acid N-acetyltransferase